MRVGEDDGQGPNAIVHRPFAEFDTLLNDERTGADVARFLGVSEANVRVIRHRAMHQLRDCMGVTL